MWIFSDRACPLIQSGESLNIVTANGETTFALSPIIIGEDNSDLILEGAWLPDYDAYFFQKRVDFSVLDVASINLIDMDLLETVTIDSAEANDSWFAESFWFVPHY